MKIIDKRSDVLNDIESQLDKLEISLVCGISSWYLVDKNEFPIHFFCIGPGGSHGWLNCPSSYSIEQAKARIYELIDYYRLYGQVIFYGKQKPCDLNWWRQLFMSNDDIYERIGEIK